MLVGQLLDGAVEIARRLFGFQPLALLFMQGILGMSVFLGQLVGDIPRVRKYLAVAQPQEIVQLGNPIGHVHRSMAAGLEFGKVEIGRNNQVQRLDFRLGQVVFRNGDIGFANGTSGAFFHEVRPMCGFAASARWWTISAAVWPWAAQCILF